MIKVFFFLLSGVFFLSSIGGCKNTGTRSPVVAQVDNEAITLMDIDDALASMPRPYRDEFTGEHGKMDLLRNLIDQKLLAKEAIKIGLDRQANVLNELKKVNNPTRMVREQVLADAYLQKRLSELSEVTEGAMKDYYLKQQNEFVIPERIKIKRIVFNSREQAEAAHQGLQKGETFEKFMENNAGFRREITTLWMQKRDKNSEMEGMAFKLQTGAVSPVVTLPAGYCLLRIEEKVPSKVMSFEEVKEGIKAKFQMLQRTTFMDNLKKELRAHVHVAINEDILKSYQWKENIP